MEITFNYNGLEVKYQCNDTEEKVSDIFYKFINNVDINSIIFLYYGNILDRNLTIGKMHSFDNERKNINIIIIDKISQSNSVYIYSKDTLCPKCGQCAKFDITEYKILLQCRNGHNLGNIFLKDYKDTQKIDITKIICDDCLIKNKAYSYKSIFYRCNQCKKNLCISCQNKHNKDHICINYDDKNYICDIYIMKNIYLIVKIVK